MITIRDFQINLVRNDAMRDLARLEQVSFDQWQATTASLSLSQLDRVYVFTLFNELINPIVDAEIAYRICGELLPSGD